MTRNKENLNKWARENYQKRKDEPEYKQRRRDTAKKYYDSHKEKCREKRREYASKNKKRYNEYRRKYRYENPAGIYSVIKNGLTRNGSKRKNLLKISKKDFIEWYKKQEKICFYCKRSLDKIKIENDRLNNKSKRLTVDRTDNNKGYENGNLVLCCMRCNAVKSDYFTKNEMIKIGKIIYDKNNRRY